LARPPDLLQGALSIGEAHLRKGEWFQAQRTFTRAAAMAEGPDRELALGLRHLAAAGYKRLQGDERGAERQLTHARRRLSVFLPSARRLDLAALLATVDDGRG
jgi:hypothetical protein